MKSSNGNVHLLEIQKNSNKNTHTDDSRFEMTTPTEAYSAVFCLYLGNSSQSCKILL